LASFNIKKKFNSDSLYAFKTKKNITLTSFNIHVVMSQYLYMQNMKVVQYKLFDLML